MSVGLWLLEDCVARIRPSDSDQQVVLRREVGGDLSFAFATQLPANQNVDEPLLPIPRNPEPSRRSHKYVGRVASVRVYDDIGQHGQFIRFPFSWILTGGLEPVGFAKPTRPVSISHPQDRLRSGQVDVLGAVAIRLANGGDLRSRPHAIDYRSSTFLRGAKLCTKPLADPGPARLHVQAFAFTLERETLCLSGAAKAFLE